MTRPHTPWVSVIIVAAGLGSRFGSDKVRALLGGKPVWKWSYDKFFSHPSVAEIIVVGEAADVKTVPGGATRVDSCRAGLSAVSPEAEVILIHDAARPFVTSEVIDRVIQGCLNSGAAAAAIAVVDTLRLRESSSVVNRHALMAMQTPQGGEAQLLRKSLAAAPADCPDEVAALEAIGAKWEAVEGDPSNFKLTYAGDLVRAQQLLTRETRTGLGYDVHAFSTSPSRELWLGGVLFPGEQGLEGHSDADALIHAVVDAIIGAAALGDIGVHFPPSDPQWKGEPSITFLKYAAKLINEAGWTIANVDASLIAERPKVMPRALDIRKKMADALGIELDRVSIKATTNEGLGAIGRGEGIAALATATLERWG